MAHQIPPGGIIGRCRLQKAMMIPERVLGTHGQAAPGGLGLPTGRGIYSIYRSSYFIYSETLCIHLTISRLGYPACYPFDHWTPNQIAQFDSFFGEFRVSGYIHRSLLDRSSVCPSGVRPFTH